ncbi:hypothetical protein PG993_006816 [Apiospora rasikravindrae]|uniref:Secreted protein n=1 Tax=Apiospora rasikravindrae TaxID=990691 RepID=A0ABR1T6S1_9PEZI
MFDAVLKPQRPAGGVVLAGGVLGVSSTAWGAESALASGPLSAIGGSGFAIASPEAFGKTFGKTSGLAISSSSLVLGNGVLIAALMVCSVESTSASGPSLATGGNGFAIASSEAFGKTSDLTSGLVLSSSSVATGNGVLIATLTACSADSDSVLSLSSVAEGNDLATASIEEAFGETSDLVLNSSSVATGNGVLMAIFTACNADSDSVMSSPSLAGGNGVLIAFLMAWSALKPVKGECCLLRSSLVAGGNGFAIASPGASVLTSGLSSGLTPDLISDLTSGFISSLTFGFTSGLISDLTSGLVLGLVLSSSSVTGGNGVLMATFTACNAADSDSVTSSSSAAAGNGVLTAFLIARSASTPVKGERSVRRLDCSGTWDSEPEAVWEEDGDGIKSKLGLSGEEPDSRAVLNKSDRGLSCFELSQDIGRGARVRGGVKALAGPGVSGDGRGDCCLRASGETGLPRCPRRNWMGMAL